MPGQLERKPLFRISTWNICGLSNNSVFGDKISNKDLLIDSVHFCDIVVLTETWQKALDLIIPGFRSFNQPAIKLNNSAKGGRGSWGGGGVLAVFIREEYANYILPLKSDNNTLWFKKQRAYEYRS